MQRPEPLAERLMAIVTRTFHGLLWQATESLKLLGPIEFFATTAVIVAISVVITTVIAIATAATLVAVVAATAAEVAGATLVVFLVHGAPATHVI